MLSSACVSFKGSCAARRVGCVSSMLRLRAVWHVVCACPRIPCSAPAFECKLQARACSASTCSVARLRVLFALNECRVAVLPSSSVRFERSRAASLVRALRVLCVSCEVWQCGCRVVLWPACVRFKLNINVKRTRSAALAVVQRSTHCVLQGNLPAASSVRFAHTQRGACSSCVWASSAGSRQRDDRVCLACLSSRRCPNRPRA